jgi:hypothetical protein
MKGVKNKRLPVIACGDGMPNGDHSLGLQGKPIFQFRRPKSLVGDLLKGETREETMLRRKRETYSQ